ncbi:hypothetical protein [Rugosimonospora africana]|uniref:hypothetical protein n=1 Tax=Rugosimonospora africana TaxID=556532 RepID=UPI0019433A5E|nr:hypothetical protein [Rugosimonospora africana]
MDTIAAVHQGASIIPVSPVERSTALGYARLAQAACSTGFAHSAFSLTEMTLTLQREAVVDPVFLALATALATRLGTEGAGAAWSALVRLVHGRARGARVVEGALESAQAAPHDADRVQRLAEALQVVADSDADFLKQVHELWPSANRELASRVIQNQASATQNQISGIVFGGALQAGTLNVNGDLELGRTDPGQPQR